MTWYDVFYDDLCHMNEETIIYNNCRKLSRRAVKLSEMSPIVVTALSRPLPSAPFDLDQFVRGVVVGDIGMPPPQASGRCPKSYANVLQRVPS